MTDQQDFSEDDAILAQLTDPLDIEAFSNIMENAHAQGQSAFATRGNRDPFVGFGSSFGQSRLDLIHPAALFPERAFTLKHEDRRFPSLNQSAAETQNII